jgi:hypothetical protein
MAAATVEAAFKTAFEINQLRDELAAKQARIAGP